MEIVCLFSKTSRTEHATVLTIIEIRHEDKTELIFLAISIRGAANRTTTRSYVPNWRYMLAAHARGFRAQLSPKYRVTKGICQVHS